MPLNGSLTIVDAAGKIQAAVENTTVPDGFNGGTPLTAARLLTITNVTNLARLAALGYDTPGRMGESSAGPITHYIAGIPLDVYGRVVVADAPVVRYAPNAIPLTATGAVAMTSGAVADTTPPTAPTTLLATVNGETQVTLTWGAATDAVGVTLYRIERCTGAACVNFAEIATDNASPYVDATLAAATAYRYQVRAQDAAGNLGPYSNIASAVTPDTTAPTAPTALVATANSPTQITLTWSAPTDNVGVTGYRLERCTGAGCSSFSEIATPAASPYVDTGRTAETTYRYQIRARDAANNVGPYSSIATATTPAAADVTPPTAPTTLVATPNTETQITLTWGAATDAVGVTLYRIERCTGAGCVNFAEIGTDPASPYVDGAGLAVNTTYRYQVRAQDAALNLGPYSNIATALTPDQTAPSVPTGLAAVQSGQSQINLTWNASTDNVAVAGYNLERCTGAACSNFAQIATPAGTSYSDTPVTVGLTYRYQVRARDAVPNYSGYSSIVTHVVTDVTAPTAPTAPVATPNSETQITVSWTAATDNVAVTGYRVERCTGAACSNFVEVAQPSASPFVDTGRVVNTLYRYQIRAIDAANNLGPYSAIAETTTPDQTAPTVPGSPVATANSATQISLTWTASTDNIGVTGYKVERCTGAGCSSFAEVGTPAASPFVDTGRTESTLYRYQVRAVDAAGNNSGYSAIAEATTQATVGATITPIDLFAAGELGGWWDPSDMSTMFQDTAGATPVTAVGQAVARINDKSGRGNHLTQATAGSRPLLQNANFENYLDFDGVDDFLVSPTINFATAVVQTVTIWLGVNKTTDTPTGSALELSANSSSNNGVFMWQIPGTSPNGYFFRSRGTADPQLNVNGFLQPRLDVLTSQSTINTDYIIARINGTQVANSSGDQGTGPYGNWPMYMGRRGGTTQPFKGRIYQAIVRGAVTTLQHMIDIERYVAGRTGVAITATPLDLFLGGEVGSWWDPSDISTLFQDSAGTVPVTASGQSVGMIKDKSGRGNHLTQTTAASMPTYIDAAGLKSLQFDGVNDWMVSPTINFAPGGGVMNMFAGLFADANTGVGLVCELSATSSGNNGTFALQAPPGDLDGFYWRSKGTVDTTLDVDGISLPTTKVIHGQSGIPSDYSQIRVNGTQALQTLADQGTGTHGNFPVYVGMRGGTTFPFKGKIYGLILRAAPCTTKEQADTEQYLAGKSGISFVSNP